MRNVLIIAAAVAAIAGSAQAQASGKDVWVKCEDCHSVAAGGAPGAEAPNLVGVVGRKAGTFQGASDALKGAGDKGLTWTEETLDKFLNDPAAMVPDNYMEFFGVPNAADRKAVIEYIKSAPH